MKTNKETVSMLRAQLFAALAKLEDCERCAVIAPDKVEAIAKQGSAQVRRALLALTERPATVSPSNFPGACTRHSYTLVSGERGSVYVASGETFGRALMREGVNPAEVFSFAWSGADENYEATTAINSL